MSLPEAIREQVRVRAGFACEFCQVSETDAGGLLTVDHFQPSSKGGNDLLENLLYCCPRCNQHKASYWPESPVEPYLWHPRQTSAAAHFVELEDGSLHPLNDVGVFTLRRLRLNRPQLIAYRLRRRTQAEESRWLARSRDLVQVLKQLNQQQAELLNEQQRLLEQQRGLLRQLLDG